MTEHLPECMTSVVRMNYDCICPELRACEERVRADERSWQGAVVVARAGYQDGYDAAIAECISLGDRHIDRVNEEAEAAISEQVANQLFMNAGGIEFLVGELRAIQTLKEISND